MKKLFLLLSIMTITNYSLPCNGDTDAFIRHVESLTDPIEKSGILYLAILQSDETLAEVCITQGAQINEDGPFRPLHQASRDGRTNILRTLLTHGGNANARNKTGRTPLHEAANAEIVELLYTAAPELLEATDSAGRTPLLVAIEKDNLSVTEKLLDLGANSTSKAFITEGDVMYITCPLHLALGKNLSNKTDLKTVELLLQRGADVNALDEEGTTALYSAIEAGNITAVKKLIEHGADLFAGALMPLAATGYHRGTDSIFKDVLDEDEEKEDDEDEENLWTSIRKMHRERMRSLTHEEDPKAEVTNYLWQRMKPLISEAIQTARPEVPTVVANLITDFYTAICEDEIEGIG